MATIGEYTNEVINRLRLPFGAAELASIYIKNGLLESDQLTADNIRIMDFTIVSIVPEMLLTPDKATGDTSLKWDRDAVLSYYHLKCAEYGIPDALAEPPSEINDLSWMH